MHARKTRTHTFIHSSSTRILARCARTHNTLKQYKIKAIARNNKTYEINKKNGMIRCVMR